MLKSPVDFEIGNYVLFNCHEGFGGIAVVVEKREHKLTRHKVKMLEDDNKHQPLIWCYDGELEPIPSKLFQQKQIRRLITEITYLRSFRNLVLTDS